MKLGYESVFLHYCTALNLSGVVQVVLEVILVRQEDLELGYYEWVVAVVLLLLLDYHRSHMCRLDFDLAEGVSWH